MASFGLTTGDLASQSDWHESYRDTMKNMYRTSYQDMTHGREVVVRSDFPSGYGGHRPSVRHDLLFRNTYLDRQLESRREDPSRDAFPSFGEHIAGIPTMTLSPLGAKRPPNLGVVPHDGTTTMLKPPWATVATKGSPLNQRTRPPTMTPRPMTTPRSARMMQAGSMLGQNMKPPPTGMSDASALNAVRQANREAQATMMPSESEVLSAHLPDLSQTM